MSVAGGQSRKEDQVEERRGAKGKRWWGREARGERNVTSDSGEGLGFKV